MPIKTTFFPTGCADAISIEFSKNKEEKKTILIDSGYVRPYPRYLKKHLSKIKEEGRKVALWVITHTHSDHIGGIIKFLVDKTFKNSPSLIQQYWFNWSSIEMPSETEEIGVAQGIKLRDYLISINKHQGKDISTLDNYYEIEGAKLTILSPSSEKLEKSKVAWVKEESDYISATSDYHHTIETLLEKPFEEDNSPWNGGSIAFLFEFEGKSILFLADCHPSTIVESLKKEPFNCTVENRLKVDLVKVSHHGSAGNTSNELLELLDCRDYVFCVNGGNRNGFPTKECIAGIINSRKDKNTTTRLLFNDETPIFEEIFGIDENPTTRYNFEFIHLEEGVWTI